jgi:hypothetical protein
MSNMRHSSSSPPFGKVRRHGFACKLVTVPFARSESHLLCGSPALLHTPGQIVTLGIAIAIDHALQPLWGIWRLQTTESRPVRPR